MSPLPREVLRAHRWGRFGVAQAVAQLLLLAQRLAAPEGLGHAAAAGSRRGAHLDVIAIDDRQSPAGAAQLNLVPAQHVGAPGVADGEGPRGQGDLRGPPQQPGEEGECSRPGQDAQPVGGAVGEADRQGHPRRGQADEGGAEAGRQGPDDDGRHDRGHSGGHVFLHGRIMPHTLTSVVIRSGCGHRLSS